MDEQQYQRKNDAQIADIRVDIAELKVSVEELHVLTQDVRDILTSFRVFGTLSKWGTGVVAAVAATYAALKGFK